MSFSTFLPLHNFKCLFNESTREFKENTIDLASNFDAAFDAIHEELKRCLEGDDSAFWKLLLKLRNEDATRLLNVQDSVLLKSLKGSGLFETIHDEADNPGSNIVSSFLALDQESIQKIQSLLESFRNTWSADDQGKVMSLQQQLTGKFPLKLTKTPTEHQVQL